MMKRLAVLCFMAMLLIGVCSLPVLAQGEAYNLSVKGINTVWVSVEELSSDAKVLGLMAETLQTDAELKLRLAGMRVVTRAKGIKLPGSPNIYINVTLTESGKSAYIGVELDQNALLERNGQFAPNITTWSKGVLVIYPTAQSIRDHVKDLVDEFLNAWLSVNPKK